MITLTNEEAISLKMNKLAVDGELYRWGNDLYIGLDNGSIAIKKIKAFSSENVIRTPVVNKVKEEEKKETLKVSDLSQKYKAASAVSGNKVVMIKDGGVVNFNPMDEDNYNKAIGVSINGANAGGDVYVNNIGIVKGFSNLTANDTYYAIENGGISNSVPQEGILLKVGVAVSSTELSININHEIITI